MKQVFKNFPISVIEKAKSADVESIVTVLDYFKNYITELSTKTLKDDYGNQYIYVDNDMRARLETILIARIINDFEIISA